MTWRGLPVLFLSVMLAACASEPVNRFGGANMVEASKANAKLGLGYMMQGNNELALIKLKKALKQDDENAQAHHYIAELYNRLEEADKADRHYKQALRYAPEETAILNNYGVFLCQQNRYKESVGYFERMLENPLFKSKATTYENMGLCAEQQGNIKAAEEHFRKALRYDTKLPKSLLRMAQISFDKQSFMSAYGFFQRYSEVGPHTPQSLWLGILLERRKGNKDAVGSYSLLLRRKYADSKEAEMLQRLENRESSAP